LIKEIFTWRPELVLSDVEGRLRGEISESFSVVSLTLKRLERLEHLERMELAPRAHFPAAAAF
jgi:hypothetical protein